MGKGRKPCCDKANVKKGPWSQIEDYKLTSFIQKYGHENWRALPKLSGLARCGKSCRLRWINYLRPGLKRGDFTTIEEEAIIKLHEELGNKWSIIASKFPGRTDNEIKNVWNTYLKKRIKAKECNKVSQESSSKDNCSLDENSSSSSPSTSYSSSQPPPFSDHDIEHLNPILDDLGAPKSNTIDNVVLQDDTGDKSSSIDEVIEIPFEPNLDLWDLLDGEQPNSINLATKNDQISENMNDLECGVSKWWLVYLENELGLDHNEATSYQSTIGLKS